MEFNHTLCLYVSYYLSRFNLEAYENLGYGSMLDTHRAIGNILDVNPHTVKNMRDEFDPLHGHRKGWYQSPLGPSRVAVVRALENLDENTIRNIVLEILENQKGPDIAVLANIVNEDSQGYKTPRKFILRGPTGKQAEAFFIQHHKDFKQPFSGKLIDTRDMGCGYDFEIHNGENKYFIEVKGLYEMTGGVLFTNKEWDTAQKKGANYFLVIIKSLGKRPDISFICNPVSRLSAKRTVYTSVQVNWTITEKELKKISNG